MKSDMRQDLTKKLALHQGTLRALTAPELTQVVGGGLNDSIIIFESIEIRPKNGDYVPPPGPRPFQPLRGVEDI